jgi:hypothetical protein
MRKVMLEIRSTLQCLKEISDHPGEDSRVDELEKRFWAAVHVTKTKH